LPQPALNILRGRPKSALKNIVDLGGDVVDTILPGDLIPHISEEDDLISPHEALGIDSHDSPTKAKIADIIGNTVLNPLTYLTGGRGANGATYKLPGGAEVPGLGKGVSKLKELAKSGYERLPEGAQDVGRKAAATVRRSMNWLDLTPEQEAQIASAKAHGDLVNDVNLKGVDEAYSPVTEAERGAVGDIMHGINRKGTDDRALWETINNPDDYISSRTDIRPDVVRKTLEDRKQISLKQLDEPGIFGDKHVYENSAGQRMKIDDLKAQRLIDEQEGMIHPNTSIEDYADQRGFTGKIADEPLVKDYIYRKMTGMDKVDNELGIASPIKPRKEELKTPEGLLQHLRANPKVDLEFDALKADAARASKQGKLASQAALGKNVLGMDDFTLANPEHMQKMRDFIAKAEKDPSQADFAYKLKNAFSGKPDRNWFMKIMATANKPFKAAATYGFVLPNVAFNVRNRVGGLQQALSNDTARGTFGASASRALSDLYGAFDDGFVRATGKGRLTGGELTKHLDAIETAMKGVGGDTALFRQRLGSMEGGKDLVDALDNGVLNNFVSGDEMLSRMSKSDKWSAAKNIMDWPAAIGQGLEQRMRLGTWLDLVKRSKDPLSPSAAAKVIRDTYLDYDVPGVANRNMRDLVPFGAFMSQNLKQQAKFIAKHPVAGVVAGQLMGDSNDENIKYPWMEGQTSLPIGLDETGNPQYITNFGMPIEALASIPGGVSGSQNYKDIVGNLQPLLKTAIASSTGIDPFTGNDFGSYDKILGQPAGAIGRTYNNIKGTGILQPLEAMAKPVNIALDERKNVPEKLASYLTGVHIQSVDPDLAQRQKIEAYLKTRPDVKRAPSYYQTEADPETTDMLNQLKEAKAKLKAKREAAKAML
jgi:hypothetical protein